MLSKSVWQEGDVNEAKTRLIWPILHYEYDSGLGQVGQASIDAQFKFNEEL